MGIKRYLRQGYNNLRGKSVLENVFESSYEKKLLAIASPCYLTKTILMAATYMLLLAWVNGKL